VRTSLFRQARVRLSLPVVISLVAAVLLTSEPSSATTPVPAGSWPYPNGDLDNTRVAAGSTISAANVSQLQQAWAFKLPKAVATGPGSLGSLVAGPIVSGGEVYLQDLASNVYAVDLATGELDWEYAANLPKGSEPSPNGVAVAGGRVYGATPTAVFALNASTGQRAWLNSAVLTKGEGLFGIQPEVADGRVYLASQYGLGPGGGVLVALSAATGQLLWKFNTVLGEDAGVEAVGSGSGGAWDTPLVSDDGSVTYGTGNPYQPAAAAIAHPAAQLYTDSLVNLDAATGQLRWYYQAIPDDFRDYDMEASPVSTTINGGPAVIGGGKMGYVYAINAKTGSLIWKTAVGEHNGHDNYSVLAMEHKLTLTAPYTILPGSFGGILTDMAVAGNSVYVATDDVPFTVTSLDNVFGHYTSPAAGEVEALNLVTGKVQWDTKVADMPLGAVTISNDLVFTTLYHGALLALNRTTGAIVDQIQLPTSTNAPLAVAGNTVLVAAGGPTLYLGRPLKGGNPQLVAYTAP